MSPNALQARNVGKAYGADGIIEDVDLAVRENEILLLLGPNGVGKTVLLSCLAGSDHPSTGDVAVFGRPVDEDGGENYGFLCQEAMTVDSLTGRENAAFYGRLHPAFTDRWERYADELSLAEDLDTPVEDYSGGTCRKLELALTMSLDVPLYLLDEPTAGVDLSAIQQFHDVILERYEAGASMVISSHRPMDVDVADRLAFLTDGTVSTVGTPEELVADVPSVVRVTGTDAVTSAEEVVLGGQLFPVGGEARGFLPPRMSVETLREVVEESDGSGTVDRIDPTHADLFNYYVHVHPQVSHRE